MRVAGRTAKETFANPRVAELALAAAVGDVAAVDRLVKAGVPVDALGVDDCTPLTFALLTPNLRGVEALLRNGANANHAIVSSGNAEGRWPILLMIASRPEPDLLEVMLKFGGDPNTREPVERREHPYRGDSLLILSVRSIESVKTLVRYGADVNVRPRPEAGFGGHSAASVAAILGQFDVVDFLIDHGATELDQVAHELQKRSWPPDVLARRLRTLQKLRGKGARIFGRYKTGEGRIVSYHSQVTPPEMLSPGYYEQSPHVDERVVLRER